jgi:hypothetical protein
MKKMTLITRLLIAAMLMMAFVFSGYQPAKAYAIPTFSILTVDKDNTVTVQSYNFPADQSFTVRMGPYGSLGIGGTEVNTFNSGPGGTFSATYSIPAILKGSDRIAIRMDGTNGYYSYNWFWNNPSGSSSSSATAVPVYYGIPTFSITSVVTDNSVTILTNNFPAGQDFKVLIGNYGTLGIGGIQMDTTSTGSGGSFSKTYTIPASLHGSQRLAIRLESTAGYYAYNWFWNNTGGSSATAVPTATPGGPTVTPVATSVPSSSYAGYPYFYIGSVVRNNSVTLTGYNFPPHTTFTVRMGGYGTLGVGGIVVGTTDSGSGGTITATYTIPAGLTGSDRIAIRMDGGIYYAFNWFWNFNAP